MPYMVALVKLNQKGNTMLVTVHGVETTNVL
jgi:hypothetical protein